MNRFDTFALNDNKYQIDLKNYVIEDGKSETRDNQTEISEPIEFLAHQECVNIISPQISLWSYMDKNEVDYLLKIKKKDQLRLFLKSKLQKKPKGVPKIIFLELMYTVAKFCKLSKFNLEQTGAVLSQFYLTHLFFTSSQDIGAEKLYEYFKSLQFCHSLPFPPRSVKLFNLEEAKNIMTYFCRLYLRNLPLIKFMCLPNFSLQVNYVIPPEKKLGKKKKGTDKKKKRKKK